MYLQFSSSNLRATAWSWCFVIWREIKQGSPTGCDCASLDWMWKAPLPLQDKDRNPRSKGGGFTGAPQPHSTPPPRGAAARRAPGRSVTCSLPKLATRRERARKAAPATAAPGCPPARRFQARRGRPAPARPAQPPRHCSAARTAPPRRQNPRDPISPSPATRKQNKQLYFCTLHSSTTTTCSLGSSKASSKSSQPRAIFGVQLTTPRNRGFVISKFALQAKKRE